MRVILLFRARVSVSFRRLSNRKPIAEPTRIMPYTKFPQRKKWNLEFLIKEPTGPQKIDIRIFQLPIFSSPKEKAHISNSENKRVYWANQLSFYDGKYMKTSTYSDT